MKREMRRQDRAIPESEAKQILEKGEYGILSTVSGDGQPYGVPLSYSYVGDVIYFHCAPEGHKLDNIGGNNKVSFCVVGKTAVVPEKFGTTYESAIVFGEVLEAKADEKHAGLLALLRKYSPGYIEGGLKYIETTGGGARVYKITVESITGKAKMTF